MDQADHQESSSNVRQGKKLNRLSRAVLYYLNWFSSPLSENKILPTKSFSLEERKDVLKVFSYECGIGEKV
jgi:hypothetical protein